MVSFDHQKWWKNGIFYTFCRFWVIFLLLKLYFEAVLVAKLVNCHYTKIFWSIKSISYFLKIPIGKIQVKATCRQLAAPGYSHNEFSNFWCHDLHTLRGKIWLLAGQKHLFQIQEKLLNQFAGFCHDKLSFSRWLIFAGLAEARKPTKLRSSTQPAKNQGFRSDTI